MLPRSKTYRENKVARLLINFIIVLLVLVVAIKSYELYNKRAEYREREAQIEEEIAYEQNRAEEIAEYEKYTQTKAYVEEVARDRLGLVYEGEILFKDENKDN